MQLAQLMVSLDEFSDQRALSTLAHGIGRQTMRVVNPKKELVRKSFLYKATICWNELTTEIHLIKRVEKEKSIFKNLFVACIKAEMVKD